MLERILKSCNAVLGEPSPGPAPVGAHEGNAVGGIGKELLQVLRRLDVQFVQRGGLRLNKTERHEKEQQQEEAMMPFQ